MGEPSGIKPFLCDTIDKASIRIEWQKWVRAFQLYLDSENIQDVLKKRNKLLHLGGMQLQEVAYNIPGAIVPNNENEHIDVFQILVDALTKYFSPTQNSAFERHTFRNIKPEEGETLNRFLLRLRQQATKCSFGNNAEEACEINIKDKLIDNWAPVELKRKLLEKERSLLEIIDLCQIHEQIKDQSKVMGMSIADTPSTSVNRIAVRHQSTHNNDCYRCGGTGHQGNDDKCPAKKVKCHKCNIQGHFAFKCKTKTRQQPNRDHFNSAKRRKITGSRVRYLNPGESDENEHDHEGNNKHFECFKIDHSGSANSTNQDELIECYVGGVPITLLIDSGSKVNIVNGSDWYNLTQGQATMWNINSQTKNALKPYAVGQTLEVLQQFQTTVSTSDQKKIITSFLVVEEGDVSILGKDTAKRLGVLKLGLGVNSVMEVRPFPKIKNIKIKLSIDKSIKPVQQPLRRVPIAVEASLERKLNEALLNIIEPVNEHSPWISPIVITYKSNGDIRICVDMRRANEAILRENFPLPTFDSMMAKIGNAKYFSRLDLEWAYHQIELDEESRRIITFITHKGMFRYKRLMFGVTSAPEIFQRIFENLLTKCTNCLNYLDDIIVYGSKEQEHDACLERVLRVFQENNVLLNKSKCTRKVQQLHFLGHRLSHVGIDADQDKVKTILQFRSPNTKEEVRSFLGLVTYLGKFIPDLATTTEPLRQLTKKDMRFRWGEIHQAAFEKLKQALTKSPTLGYFDPRKRTRVIADASPVALGAVLIQFDGEIPKVISFASKGLSETERRYSQTEKESLALVWGVERFYFYLTGLTFELITDHKPLETIFKPTSRPPARIERWVLRLQAFKFKVIYQSGKSNIADSISRLCQLNDAGTFDKDSDNHIFTVVECSTPRAMSISQITNESKRDKELTYAIDKSNDDSWVVADKSVYYPFRLELTTLGPILLRNNRIVIPTDLRRQVLQLAHEGHPGVNVMKRRLRAKVWWPLIDRQVEEVVKQCRDCLLVSQPDKPPLMTRNKFPDGPWQYLALDLMGPLPNQDQVLVIIDYYSRYQDIKFLRTTTSCVIIKHLNELFSRLGIPKSIRADNGRQFSSKEFQQFCESNNIKLIHTPPYWPQANGEVENMNKSILKRLQICHNNKQDYRSEIQKFILMYNVTPHGTTGKSPSELLFNRRIRDKIPSITDIVGEDIDQEAQDNDIMNKQKGKEREDSERKARGSNIGVGDKVVLQNMVIPHKLTTRFNNTEYEVIERNGNEVTLVGDGKTVKRHVSHVKRTPTATVTTPRPVSTDTTGEPRGIASGVEVGEPTTSSSETATSTSTLRQPQPTDINISEQEAFEKIEPLRLEKKDGMWERASTSR